MARHVPAVAVALLALSCSGDPSDPGRPDRSAELAASPEYREACSRLPTCARPRFRSEGPSETIWRVPLVREPSGAIRFGAVEAVRVTAGTGVPLGPVTGDHVLLALDASGEPLDGRMVQFPSVARIEVESERAPPILIDFGDLEAMTVGHLRALPKVERLVVRDPSGETVASMPAPARSARLAEPGLPRRWGLAAPALAQEVGPTWPCSHVRILGEGDEDAMGFSPLQLDMELQTPGPEQHANIMAALGRMTPLLCQSVSRIAFGSFVLSEALEDVLGNPGLGVVMQTGWGDMMMVNADAYAESVLTAGDANATYKKLDLQHTILHEAGHAAEALLNAEGDSLLGLGYEGDWVDGARELARETIDRVRMARGFGEEWSRVHESYVDLGWARGHTSTADTVRSIGDFLGIDVTDLVGDEGGPYDWPQADVARGGFVSPYAATNPADDIADAIAWTTMSDAFATAGVTRRDYGCTEMQAHGASSLPADLAAVYTKLHFVKDLGLVDSGDLDRCTGAAIGPPVGSEGFEVWQGGSLQRSFGSDVWAHIGTTGLGTRVFEMEAGGSVGFDGTSYPAKMKLRLDLDGFGDSIRETPWPRGAYPFALRGDNVLTLRAEDNRHADFDSYEGYAVVVEASNDRIVGSVFLTKAMRLHTVVPVPQVFDPPLQIRFLLDKGAGA